MEVKIAEPGGINSAAEASEAFRAWLNEYVIDAGGGTFDVPEVDIEKRDDGWYAVMDQPPRRASE